MPTQNLAVMWNPEMHDLNQAATSLYYIKWVCNIEG